jgi:hypothetical protein
MLLQLLKRFKPLPCLSDFPAQFFHDVTDQAPNGARIVDD